MNSFYHNRYLIGLGLNAADDHKRITKGENFTLLGGSLETHEKMQEQTLGLISLLKKKGKTIITADDQEFYETALEVGMDIHFPENN